MSSIDIRIANKEEINEIVFADAAKGYYAATMLALYEDGLLIEDDKGSNIFIDSKEHALNLIKALNKAIELGWLE